jgi:hypothetical protein
MRTLTRVQRGLETLYRVDTGVAVDDFVIDDEGRAAFSPARRPREQLLAIEDNGEMNLALYIDPDALAPSYDRLGDHNLGDFLLVVEGVSHFIYTVWCARAERPVTQLELELQAEVDKYVTCLLQGDPARSPELRRRLFVDCEYEPDLDSDERERYRAANDNAHRYAAWLETEYVAPRRIPEMLCELRRFYRAGLAAKLSSAARASR